MIAPFGEYAELRQSRKCDIHSERSAFALPMMHSAMHVGIHCAGRNEAIKQQLRVSPCDDAAGPPRLTAGDYTGSADPFPAIIHNELLNTCIEVDFDAIL